MLELIEDIYYRMLAIFNSARDMGLDSITFRKLKYRLAILNERQYGDPGIGVIRSLISKPPSYDKYHIALRGMLWKHPDIIKAYREEGGNEPDGKLVESLLDPNSDEQEFLKQLKAARAEKNSDWNSYRHLINEPKLPMAF